MDDLKQQSCSEGKSLIDFSWSLELRTAKLPISLSLLRAVNLQRIKAKHSADFSPLFFVETCFTLFYDYRCDN